MDQFLSEYRPQRPWASNSLKESGVKRMNRDAALGMKYIEPNVKGMRNLIVVDLDIQEAAWDLKSKVFDDNVLPVPSFISTNPGTTHAHAGWFVEGVATTPKQIHVFEGLRKKMAKVAGGDSAYTGSIFRNPLSGWASTEYFDAPLYSFDTLSNYTKGITLPKRAETVSEGEGRNVTLFEAGRLWAYGEYYRALKNDRLEFFRASLVDFLIAENSLFDRPLTPSEANSIARSIEKFVSTRFDLKKFEAKQEAQRQKSIQVRKQKAASKHAAIKEIMNTGASMKLACDTLGINYNSARASWAKWEGKK